MARTGREVMLEVLADEGAHHLFGNPGTTELPLIDELAAHPEFEYILALQENSVVGMADGYAQATGRPAFVNLHTSSGLGGGMGNITNAFANRTPLVVTAGQQDRRHLVNDPMLSGDLVGMCRAVTKWQHEVRNGEELGVILRRAFKDAANPPSGPVFVSIPMDVLDQPGEFAVPARSDVRRDAVAEGLADAAKLLADAAPDAVALVVGEEVATAHAFPEVTALAEALGAKVFGAPFFSASVFPTDHPLWRGMLGGSAVACRTALAPYRVVFYIGGQVGFVYPYSPGPAVPPSAQVVHLSGSPELVGRAYPTELGMVGDVRRSVAVLTQLVAPLVDRQAAADALDAARTEADASRDKIEATAVSRYAAVPMNPMAAVHALLAGAPPSLVVVDEAVTTGGYARGFHRTVEPGSYYFSRGGGLGWGMPAALGIKLAQPERPVLCIVGDGAAMYSIQSLYTAARYGLGVVFAVVNNRQYRILRDNLASSGGRSAESGRYVGLDLDDPPIDYVSIAKGLGVDALLIERAADVTDATRAAFESGKPRLLELPIQRAT